jgi:hypothetical protein
MKRGQRTLSLILTVLLCLSLLPMGALASEEAPVEAAVEVETTALEKPETAEEAEAESVEAVPEEFTEESEEPTEDDTDETDETAAPTEDAVGEEAVTPEESTLEISAEAPIETEISSEMEDLVFDGAGTASEITAQITNTYNEAKNRSGLSGFNGWCATYVNWQLVILGINSSYVAADGKDEYDNYKNLSKTSGGYPVTAYPASSYTLSSALNAITSNGKYDAYNILVGFEIGSDNAAGRASGHTVFIHAILNGIVYFSDSFGATIDGKYYTEGSPIACSISTFCSFYNSITVQLDGVIHFAEKNYLSKCTLYPCYRTVKITSATTLKTFPCSASTDSTSKNVRTPSIGETFTATGLYKNTAGNYWYRVTDGSTTCYLSANNASSVAALYTDVTISGVSAPTSLTVGSRFSIKGDVKSTYNTITTVYGYVYPRQR